MTESDNYRLTLSDPEPVKGALYFEHSEQLIGEYEPDSDNVYYSRGMYEDDVGNQYELLVAGPVERLQAFLETKPIHLQTISVMEYDEGVFLDLVEPLQAHEIPPQLIGEILLNKFHGDIYGDDASDKAQYIDRPSWNEPSYLEPTTLIVAMDRVTVATESPYFVEFSTDSIELGTPDDFHFGKFSNVTFTCDPIDGYAAITLYQKEHDGWYALVEEHHPYNPRKTCTGKLSKRGYGWKLSVTGDSGTRYRISGTVTCFGKLGSPAFKGC